jgi:hypothetical protein
MIPYWKIGSFDVTVFFTGKDSEFLDVPVLLARLAVRHLESYHPGQDMAKQYIRV